MWQGGHKGRCQGPSQTVVCMTHRRLQIESTNNVKLRKKYADLKDRHVAMCLQDPQAMADCLANCCWPNTVQVTPVVLLQSSSFGSAKGGSQQETPTQLQTIDDEMFHPFCCSQFDPDVVAKSSCNEARCADWQVELQVTEGCAALDIGATAARTQNRAERRM